jgi:FixJ family two-component response regulator
MPKAPLISLVEDDDPFRGSLIKLLRSLGYAVEAFSSAADFLASRSLGETACLITDIKMPAMTGRELCARLLELGHNIPTILVTAYADDAMVSRASNDGVVCCLRKPFDDNDLADCVQRALERGKPSEKS